MAVDQYADKVRPYLNDIAGWLVGGASQKDIAMRLGISLSALKNYRAQHDELDTVLGAGKKAKIMDITKAVTDMATGYVYETTEVIKVKNADGSERAQTVKVKKFQPPVLAASKYILENLQPKKWAENPRLLDLKQQEIDINRMKVMGDMGETSEMRPVVIDDV